MNTERHSHLLAEKSEFFLPRRLLSYLTNLLSLRFIGVIGAWNYVGSASSQSVLSHHVTLDHPTNVFSHDSSVGEWTYLTVCPLHGPGLIPGLDGVFQGIFPRLIMLHQPALVAENNSNFPQWHHTSCEDRGKKPKSNYGETMDEKIKCPTVLCRSGSKHHWMCPM